MLVMYVGSIIESREVKSSSSVKVVVQVALPEVSRGLQFMVPLRRSTRSLFLTCIAAQ